MFASPQQQQQSVDDYLNKMERKAAKTKMAEEQVRHAVIYGLRPAIRQQVLQHDIQNMQQIRHWATIAEASENQNDSQNELAQMIRELKQQNETILKVAALSTDKTQETQFQPQENYSPQGYYPQQQYVNYVPAHPTPIQQPVPQPTYYTPPNQWRNSGPRPAQYNTQYNPRGPNIQNFEPRQPRPRPLFQNLGQQCGRCLRGPHSLNLCPARDITCYMCKGQGHIARACRNMPRTQ